VLSYTIYKGWLTDTYCSSSVPPVVIIAFSDDKCVVALGKGVKVSYGLGLKPFTISKYPNPSNPGDCTGTSNDISASIFCNS